MIARWIGVWARTKLLARGVLFAGAVRREIDQELRDHVSQRARELEQTGVPPREARRRAEAAFGDMARVRSECHDLFFSRNQAKGDGLMSELAQHLKYALRTLYKNPAFAAVVIATLALGIGANTAIFSIVNAVVLRPLDYGEPEELVRLWQSDRLNGSRFEYFSLPDYADLLGANTAFSDIAATTTQSVTLTGADRDPEQLLAVAATHNLFKTLGATPSRGRAFTAEEDVPGGERVTVISHGAWMSLFGGDEEILARSIELDDVPYRVVGVMGPEFRFGASGAQIWLPMQTSPSSTSRGRHSYGVVARLASGVDLETAATSLAAVATALEAQYPETNENRGMWPQPMHESVVGEVRPALMILLGAVGVVLLIACVNVANLLLVRASTRQNEVAIQAAMGARRARLIRQFLVESLLLSVIGGAVGGSLAAIALRVFGAVAPDVLPRQGTVTVDGWVLGFTALTTAAAALIFGVIPALQASRASLQGALSAGGRGAESGRTRQRAHRVLVVAEVALAVALVAGAGLLLRSFQNLNGADPGFSASRALTFELQLPASRYHQARSDWPVHPEVSGFQNELLERLRTIPGVEAAALTLNLPTAGGWTTRVQIDEHPLPPERQLEEIRFRIAGSSYAETMGIELLEGRRLTARDDRADSPPVVLVNQSFVERYLPDTDPIGLHVTNWGTSREIVGVVENVRFMGPSESVPPAVYPTFAQLPFSGFAVILRTAGDPLDLLPTVRHHLRDLDPHLPLTSVQTVAASLSGRVAQPRLYAILLGLFAAVAMTLAAVGIYGVIAYGVSQRRREIGVRMSLGAGTGEVLRDVLKQGLLLAITGVALGLLGSLALSRVLSGLLVGVEPTDPATFASVALLVVAVAATATFVPALRAARVDPIEAMRND